MQSKENKLKCYKSRQCLAHTNAKVLFSKLNTFMSSEYSETDGLDTNSQKMFSNCAFVTAAVVARESPEETKHQNRN